jgi:glycosyltransferase involved in cell wall biosynthesis
LIQVLYTAAHAVPGSELLPIGGGATICRWLVDEWQRTRPFSVRVVGPAVLGVNAPSGADLVRYSESRYACFCRDFECAATIEILRHDPSRTVVLANDISEGPDFKRLAEAGFKIVTIYHVDVVAYVTAIYGKGLLKPETTTRWYDRLRGLPIPDVLRLVWEKQRASVHYSTDLIVPSGGMRGVLERCYPRHAAGKVRIVPWGAQTTEPVGAGEVEQLKAEFGIAPGARVLLTLSRISPEKGQDLLLESLIQWERQLDARRPALCVFICGEPAFMQGERYMARLRSLAARLKDIRIFFPGHVTGARKHAFFAMADLYVFPSRHESYGLTLMEALAAGLPAVSLDHHGSREVMQPEFGETVDPRDLHRAIARFLLDPSRLQAASGAAKKYAAQQRFDSAAARVAEIILVKGDNSGRSSCV